MHAPSLLRNLKKKKLVNVEYHIYKCMCVCVRIVNLSYYTNAKLKGIRRKRISKAKELFLTQGGKIRKRYATRLLNR